MNRLSVRQLASSAGLTGSFGGIKISVANHAGSLDSLHFLFDEKAGFSAILKMFDYDPKAQIADRDHAGTGIWTLRAPMLALSNPDPALAFPVGTTLSPQIFVRNTTARAVNASLLFNWRNDTVTGKAVGPVLHLNPFETRRIDVAALQDGQTLPKNAHWASVTLTTDSQPREVIAVAASYDPSLHYGAQTPFTDQMSAHLLGSMLEYDAQHDSIVAVGNGGGKPTLTAFTIFYNQGTGTQTYELEQTLGPDEQMWIELGKLIREHVLDKNGKTLPADLTSGTYEIRDLTNHAFGTLFEAKVIYDKTYGHVTYGCNQCCGYTTPILAWYDPLNIPIGSTADNGVLAYEPCIAGYDDVSTYFYSKWSSNNTAIASVNAYAVHTGVSVGSTTSQFAPVPLPDNNIRLNCPDSLLGGGNPGDNVTPTISGPNTLWWFNGLGLGVSGYTTQITLTANGGSGSYQWAITAGSDKVSLSTSTSATVQVTSIGQSKAANDVSITVTVGGLTSNPFNLTVRAPYTLGQDPAHTTPVYAQDPEYVWNIKIYDQILDNLLTPMPNPVSANEHWTTGPIPDYPNETWAQGAEGCGTTLSSAPAEMWDFIQGEFVGNQPPPVYNTQQNGPAVYHWGEEIRIGTCTIGAGPRVQTNTLQKYTDHAAHTGITTPAP